MFGITMGQPFPAAGVIADCPLFEPFRRENLPDELCVDTRKGFSADAIALKHVPLGSENGEGIVELRDGRVIAIRVTFDARHFAGTRDMLLDRYGPAQERAGDEAGETLRWNGHHLAMVLLERAGTGAAERGTARLEIRALAPK